MHESKERKRIRELLTQAQEQEKQAIRESDEARSRVLDTHRLVGLLESLLSDYPAPETGQTQPPHSVLRAATQPSQTQPQQTEHKRKRGNAERESYSYIDASRTLLCTECGETHHPKVTELGDFCGGCGEKIRTEPAAEAAATGKK